MKPKHYPIAIVLAAVVGLSSFYLNSVAPAGARAAAPPAANWLEELSADRYMQHVQFLASSEMKGRASGSPELERAADYIASQFRIFGLQPAGENGTYFQAFEITTGVEIGSGNSVQIDGAALQMNRDYVPIPFSSKATAEGPVVFAGYGITAPDLQWDDYGAIDANGKIVIVFRHEPGELDRNSKFNGVNFTTHATFMNKAINARRHGAKAIIFITDPNNHGGEPDAVGPATQGVEIDDVGIPAFHATRASVEPLFKEAGRDLAEIQRNMDADLTPQSFAFDGVVGRASADVVRVRKTVRNVLGAVPGSDPELKNEWIVVGAHYDHVGLGERNSAAPSEAGKIHHGADDNASGTAGILELARLMGDGDPKPRRSVLFVTFAGEELGLLGSSHFVNRPTVALNSIAGMINMDMIGRMSSNNISVIGVGTSPDFKAWLEESNQPVGLKLGFSASGIGGSDHMSFNAKRIPVLFFFSGLHADYHRPTDTADKINATGSIQILRLAGAMTQRLADAPTRPLYTEVREQRAQGAAGGGGGYSVYFGSVPDFRDDLNGVLFADIRSESPAAKAGLKAGDLLVEFDGQPIRNLNEYSYALGTKKPGDVVAVVVERNGQRIKANVTVEARR